MCNSGLMSRTRIPFIPLLTMARLYSMLTSLLLATCAIAQQVYSSDSLPFAIGPETPDGDPNYTAPIFPILPFNKYAGNPILSPNPGNNWESAFLYNPTAIVLNETIFLLYRAQNASKTSSIGLAWSTDGYNFTRLNQPIIYATEDYETIGGTEDPRIIRVNSTFHVTYTAYNNVSAQLCMASSDDMLNWNKSGILFPGWMDVAFSDIDVPSPRVNHSKSGAIVNEPIDGVYHMYFGDSFFYHATSPGSQELDGTARRSVFCSTAASMGESSD